MNEAIVKRIYLGFDNRIIGQESVKMKLLKVLYPIMDNRQCKPVVILFYGDSGLGKTETIQYLDLFTDYSALEKQRKEENAALEREKKLQKVALDIKKKFGKNAILKGMNLQDGATAKDRNKQIGGHKA